MKSRSQDAEPQPFREAAQEQQGLCVTPVPHFWWEMARPKPSEDNNFDGKINKLRTAT